MCHNNPSLLHFHSGGSVGYKVPKTADFGLSSTGVVLITLDLKYTDSSPAGWFQIDEKQRGAWLVAIVQHDTEIRLNGFM